MSPTESPTPTPETPTPTPETSASVTPTTTETSTERRTTAHMSLTLDRDEGYPATHFTGTLTGVSACANARAHQENIRSSRTELFQWDGASLPPDGGTAGVHTDPATDSAAIDFTVPTTAEPGAHEVAVACPSGRVTAQFTVLAPTLVIEPEQGYAGSSFDATVSGFDTCTPADMSFRWDDQELTSSEPGGDGRFSFTVPENAKATSHSVTASCGHNTAPATFTVLAASKPTLTLTPGHGEPGDVVTAAGTGFGCDGDVELHWDDTLLAEGLPGAFTSSFTVPPAQRSFVHTVTASCRPDSSIKDTQTFTATSMPTPIPEQPEQPEPTLTLQPTSGRTDDEVLATGEGFPCANHSGPVDLAWDDGPTLTAVSLDRSGHFTTPLLVPAKTDGGRVTLRATCSDGVVLAADFTVLSSPPPPPIPPKPDYQWVLWLFLGVIALAVLARTFRQRWRVKPPPLPQIYAVGRADAAPTVIARETPDHGETTHTLRMNTHADLGTQTVREVDDDYYHTH